MKNPNSPITSAEVTRHPRALTQAERDRAAVKRHHDAQQAALHVMDVIDEIMLREAGPRTGTHPIAIYPAPKTMDQVIEEIRLQPTAPDVVPRIHAVARSAQNYVALLAAASAFVAGLALGKAL